MKTSWYNNEGMITEQDFGTLIAIIPDGAEHRNTAMILRAPEMEAAIRKFVNDIESQSLKPKSAYKEFKEILQNIPDDERTSLQGTAQ